MGISCGATCSATFNSGTSVMLQAVAAAGYALSGWSGDSDCLDDRLTMNSNKSCIANFSRTANPTTRLTVSVVGTVTTAGKGKGTVMSSPVGITCGVSCVSDFPIGTAVTLKPIPDSGSVFSGWSGDSDCADGVVVMNSSKPCTATFAVKGNKLNIHVKGGGKGHVTANLGSIDCVTDCSVSFAEPIRVTLRAVPALGSVFVGWSGDPGCSKGTVGINVSTSCVATFEPRPSSIGVFNPTTHDWQLKRTLANTNGGCDTDSCINPWEKKKIPARRSHWIPVVGDWNGSGADALGIYSPTNSDSGASRWYLDHNGNEKWNGCENDRCLRDFGQRGDLPVVGDWSGTGRWKIGVFRPSTGEWFLDLEAARKFDGCTVDRCVVSFGQHRDLPVTGDWNASGISNIGLFRPNTGEWFLDLNGNGIWDGCNVDQCIAGFGQSGDLPVAGDWDATGASKIGLFRPATGEWFLDMNGNSQWDGTNVDKYISGFGQAGDLPVIGKW